MTSVEQGKAQEAVEIRSHAAHFIHQDHFLVLNKCLESDLITWHPTDHHLIQIKDSLEKREQDLKKQLKGLFPFVLEFPEIISLSPSDHLLHLTEKWKSYVV